MGNNGAILLVRLLFGLFALLPGCLCLAKSETVPGLQPRKAFTGWANWTAVLFPWSSAPLWRCRDGPEIQPTSEEWQVQGAPRGGQQDARESATLISSEAALFTSSVKGSCVTLKKNRCCSQKYTNSRKLKASETDACSHLKGKYGKPTTNLVNMSEKLSLAQSQAFRSLPLLYFWPFYQVTMVTPFSG